MTEHATLFQADMVRAVLREVDPKTQTRRLITSRNSLVDGAGMSQKRWDAMGFDFSRAWVDQGPSPAGNAGPYLQVPAVRDGHGETVHRIYPRVQPGDVLWGRESHAPRADCSVTWQISMIDGFNRMGHGEICYQATTTPRDWVEKWRPSIHMPRWACRLVLSVGKVGVEKVQAISTADCIAEGMTSTLREHDAECDLRDQYLSLWNRINGPDSWESNPWVWVFEFRRLP